MDGGSFHGLGPATAAVHAGANRSHFDETSEALFLTTGFTYASAEEAEAAFKGEIRRYQYTRFGNPTISTLEERIAAIEGADACRVTATGMAAIHAALLSHLKSGDRLVASRALFGSSHWIVSTLLPRYGISTAFVDGTDIQEWEAALDEPTAAVLLESPSNPMLDVLDIQRIADSAHAAGALLMVDNVFATPVLQKPFTLGADVVIYSGTKHMDGQGRVHAGAVLGRRPWIEDVLAPFLRNTGPSLSPFNAWVLTKGLETLMLRVNAASTTAAYLADVLADHRNVARVRYPGRPDHPQHAIAMAQMSKGGTMVTFDVAGGKERAFAFLNALRLVLISNNLGDAKSLATHPATTTHMRLGAEERQRLGITDGTIRLSVGLEAPDDLEADLRLALNVAGSPPDDLHARLANFLAS